jgi:fructose-1,6-bisphosphatase I
LLPRWSTSVNKAGLVDIVGDAGEQNGEGRPARSLMSMLMKFYSNIDKSLRIVCVIASEENDEFII